MEEIEVEEDRRLKIDISPYQTDGDLSMGNKIYLPRISKRGNFLPEMMREMYLYKPAFVLSPVSRRLHKTLS